MTDLAEQLINQSKRETSYSPSFFDYTLPPKDELGIPTADSINYLIARILYIDQNLTGPNKLHLRDDEHIWEGDQWVAENSKNLYRILMWKGRAFKKDQIEMIWNRLRECLPTLAHDKMVVKDNLIWDKAKGEMYFSDDKPLTIN